MEINGGEIEVVARAQDCVEEREFILAADK